MTPERRFCVRCGAGIAAGAKFCGACGTAAVAIPGTAAVAAPAPAPAAWAAPPPPSQQAPLPPAAMVPQELAANPQRSTAVIWLFIAFGGMAAAAAPLVAEIDIMKGGGALMMVGLLVAITGLVVAVVYFGRASTLTRILTTDRLVYWRYEPDEWARYTEAEHGRQKGEMRGLFIMVAVISAIVGIGFVVADPDGGKVVFFVLMGVVALCGLAAMVSTGSAHRRNASRVGDVYISRSGVYLNQVLHTWKGLGAQLDGVSWGDDSPPYLEFVYSMPARGGRQQASVRVPIPRGQEAVARGLLDQFGGGAPR